MSISAMSTEILACLGAANLTALNRDPPKKTAWDIVGNSSPTTAQDPQNPGEGFILPYNATVCWCTKQGPRPTPDPTKTDGAMGLSLV